MDRILYRLLVWTLVIARHLAVRACPSAPKSILADARGDAGHYQWDKPL